MVNDGGYGELMADNGDRDSSDLTVRTGDDEQQMVDDKQMDG